MAKVEFTRVETDEEVEDISIKDGQLIYSKSGKTYMDYGDERIPTGSGSGGGAEEVEISDTEPTDPDNKIWIDTGEIAQQVSEITNTYNTSENLGYSCNYVNNLFSYSTAEKIVGTWIDGKPLYRKVYNFTTPSSADVDSVIFTAPNNIDTMANLYGILTAGNARFTLNSYYSTSYYIATYYNPTDGIRAKVGSSLVDRSGVAILEYTKTTD